MATANPVDDQAAFGEALRQIGTELAWLLTEARARGVLLTGYLELRCALKFRRQQGQVVVLLDTDEPADKLSVLRFDFEQLPLADPAPDPAAAHPVP